MSAEALFVTDKKSESDVAVEVKIASKVVASVASAFSKDDLVKVKVPSRLVRTPRFERYRDEVPKPVSAPFVRDLSLLTTAAATGSLFSGPASVVAEPVLVSSFNFVRD